MWQKIIAVDFDGTLCESKWPEIGAPRKDVIRELIKQQAEGAKLILWTCRSDKLLDEAVTWCLDEGLVFDAVNDNIPEMIQMFGNNSRKVSATEYWDDKSVLVVGSGKVTSIAFPRSEGGMIVKQWFTNGVQFLRPPVTTPKRKRWWERWFDGLKRGSDPLSERNSAEM